MSDPQQTHPPDVIPPLVLVVDDVAHGREIFAEILAVASGKESVSESLDLGQDEFIPWQLGTVT